jgi:hypothetical protein
MEYVVGISTAVATAVFGRISGFERDRSFYPTILIVIALLYVLFATLDGRYPVVLAESAFALIFIVAALAGYAKGCLIVAAGIAAHGLFDFLHLLFIEDRGVPIWWPGFCGTVDILLGAFVGFFVCRKSSPETV